MVRPEDVPNLDDDQLMKVLKQAGLNLGPLTSTTRSLYEKRLIKFLKESKLPEENIAPSKTPSKATKTVEKPKQTPLKESNKNETLPAIPVHKSTPISESVIRQEERIEKPKPQTIRPNIEQTESRITIQKNPQKPVQEPIYTQPKTDPIPIRPPVKEPSFSNAESIQKKTDPIPIRPVQEQKVMYATNSSSAPKQQSIFAPPLNLQRERNASRESFEPRSRPIANSIFDKFEKQSKETREAQSSNSGNSTLPLEFKLISKEEEAKRAKASTRYEENPPFLGYIKTDRQIQQQNYLLDRRSIIKLDQANSARDQIKTKEFNAKPLIDLSPTFPEKKSKTEEQPQVTSSTTIAKKETQIDWLKNNLKYLLAVFVVTIIVFSFLQSAEEENPLSDI